MSIEYNNKSLIGYGNAPMNKIILEIPSTPVIPEYELRAAADAILQNEIDALLAGGDVMPHYISYNALLLAYNTSQLVPGQWYMINDFVTTWVDHITWQIMTSNETEPLLIQAVSVNKFSTICKSTLYPEDIVYYDITDSNEGATKGRILRRTDTKYNNSAPTDWRHITNKRYAINLDVNSNTWIQGQVYSPGTIVTQATYDYNFIGNWTQVQSLWMCVRTTYDWSSDISANFVRLPYNNGDHVGPDSNSISIQLYQYSSSLPVDTNNFVEHFLFENYSSGMVRNNYIGGDSSYINTVILGSSQCNTIGSSCCNITIGDGSYYNYIGENSYNITMGIQNQGNHISRGAYRVSFSHYTYYNEIGSQGSNIFLSKYNQKNSILSQGNQIYIGENCSFNYIEGSNNGTILSRFCNYNKIGICCYYTHLEDYSSYNTIGENCSGSYFRFGAIANNLKYNNHNVFLNSGCERNELSSSASYITLGQYCSNNKFGGECSSITFNSNLYSLTVKDRVSYKDFTNYSELYNRYTDAELCRTNNNNFFYKFLEDDGNTSITQLV